MGCLGLGCVLMGTILALAACPDFGSMPTGGCFGLLLGSMPTGRLPWPWP